MDAPAAEPTVAMLRVAISEGLPGDIDLADIGEWAQPALRTIATSPNAFALETRVLAAITAGMILGAKLQETQGT
jgi:hypothetical protein